MAFGTLDDTLDADTPILNEINMTPLVDVMLVLLIIFIITVPVMKHAITVALPSATAQPLATKPETLQLSVDAQGTTFLNQSPLTEAELATRLQAEARKEPQPELHIRGDKAVRYEFVAQAMAQAQQAGLRKINFVTEPRH
ncbi:MAG: biopolymer transporter ExbD [Burkholderiales bacterium]|nr:biopolymer transporter ExbD [Burkholderiales bacterium]